MIAYTPTPIARFPALAWPDWVADRQPAGSRLDSGDPVCTIFARGMSAAATCKTLRAKAHELQTQWEEGRP